MMKSDTEWGTKQFACTAEKP